MPNAYLGELAYARPASYLAMANASCLAKQEGGVLAIGRLHRRAPHGGLHDITMPLQGEHGYP